MERDRQYFDGQMLPQYFAAHGYRTLGCGKITHGYSPKIAFHQYGGKFAGSGPKPPKGKRFNYFLPKVLWTGTQTDWGAFPDSDQQMPDDQAAAWAAEQLAGVLASQLISKCRTTKLLLGPLNNWLASTPALSFWP